MIIKLCAREPSLVIKDCYTQEIHMSLIVMFVHFKLFTNIVLLPTERYIYEIN